MRLARVTAAEEEVEVSFRFYLQRGCTPQIQGCTLYYSAALKFALSSKPIFKRDRDYPPSVAARHPQRQEAEQGNHGDLHIPARTVDHLPIQPSPSGQTWTTADPHHEMSKGASGQRHEAVSLLS